jgi:Flp pilus assembly protein TadG
MQRNRIPADNELSVGSTKGPANGAHAFMDGPGFCRLRARLRKFALGADDQIVAVCRSANPKSPTSLPRAGFVLIVTAISMTLLLGLAGLGIDIGRMYVIRAELQSFTDAAALSAALELNGTDSGLARARAGAALRANGPHAMRWDMGTQPITNIATSFSSDQATWQDQPKQPGDFRFVRVVATEPAPVILLRIFQPLTSTTVAAASVAAKTDQTVRLIQ